MSTPWVSGGVGSSRIGGLLDEPRSGRSRSVEDDQVAAVIERTLYTTPAEPVVAGRVGSVAARKIRQGRRPGTKDPENPIQNPTVIDTRHTTRLLRKDRLNHPPLENRQIIAAR